MNTLIEMLKDVNALLLVYGPNKELEAHKTAVWNMIEQVEAKEKLEKAKIRVAEMEGRIVYSKFVDGIEFKSLDEKWWY